MADVHKKNHIFLVILNIIVVLSDMTGEKEVSMEKLTEMPFDKAFTVNGNEELCHATGKEVLIDNEW